MYFVTVETAPWDNCEEEKEEDTDIENQRGVEDTRDDPPPSYGSLDHEDNYLSIP